MSIRIVYDTHGGPEVLRVEEVTVGDPGPGQVRVRNQAVGVNPVDWKIVSGAFGRGGEPEGPTVPGLAAAGVVEAVGPAVSGIAVGDDVIATGPAGGYQAVTLADPALLRVRPATIDPDQGAALPVSATTGYALAETAEVHRGDTVLIHGASGAVGAAAAQVAIDRGATVIGTASPANHDYLRSLGVIPLAYGEGLEVQVRAAGQPTVILDAVGGEATVRASRAFLTDGVRTATVSPDQYARSAGITPVKHPSDELDAVIRLAAAGKLSTRIGKVLPLADAAEAFRISTSGHPNGKILLRP